ncbi:alpha/beta hydrolase-fold protein [Flagellimonas flava]|uniref:alpha/beta hydrolase-fold protein n=1 Tax=Flagellimonas flava TaxID=570519 RepID=UPI003D653718
MQNLKLALILFFLIISNGFTQDQTITITSKILGEERQIRIGLPKSYEVDGKDFKYPLVLITDGEWHFDMVQQATKLLYQDGFPKLIVAAIVNTDRGRDLALSHNQEIPSSGGAKNFHQFITRELLPKLETEYRISEHRTIMGHSLGGLFSIYALSQNLETFDGVVAITPTIRWNNFELLGHFTRDFQRELEKRNPTIFLGIGNETGLEREGVVHLATLLKEMEMTKFEYMEYPKNSHVTVPWKAYFDGLKFVFDSFILPEEYGEKDFSKTIEYYTQNGTYFDYDQRVPQRILFNRGYGAMENKNYSESIEVFEYFKKSYPNIPIPYSALGDLYFEMKEYKKAKANYEPIHQLFPSAHISERMEMLKKLLE